MGWIRDWRLRAQQEADLKEEIRTNLAIGKAEQMAGGKTPAEADRAARLEFGNLTSTEEAVREVWGWTRLETILQDMRFGARKLRKTPVWSAIVILTLALGVGMSTAIFSVVHGVLLQPLPYPEPDRLMAISPTATQKNKDQKSKEWFNPNPALWTYWREHLTRVEDIALTRPVVNFNLTGDGEPERLQAARITFNVPEVLRMRPIFGRTFSEDEQRADAKVALLSHALWNRRFGGDPAIVGRKIQLNGEPFEVIGVMPPDFRYPTASFEIWAPLYLPPSAIGHGYNFGYLCVGRLKPGATVEQAQGELSAAMRQIALEHPSAYKQGQDWMGGLIEPLAQNQASKIRPTLYLLTAAVACLLLIGCMNLAVLLIARASGRAREIVVRVALGASAQRIRHQLLAEAVPLGLGGAALGVAVAWWMLSILKPLLPADMPRVESISLNPTAFAFATIVSMAVVILASLVPARLTTAPALGSRSVTGSSGVRDWLVAAQVALALILLFAGVLFARSFAALLDVSPGFSSQGVLTMHLAVSRAKFPKDEQISAYYSRLIEAAKAAPGVLEAGIVNRLPLSGIMQTGGVEFEGLDNAILVDWRTATPGYHAALGIPLKLGRWFSDSDGADTPVVGLIDEAVAKRVFGDRNPVGTRFRWQGPPGQVNDDPWTEIVGVVGHVHNDSLESDPRPQVYCLRAMPLVDGQIAAAVGAVDIGLA